MCRDIMIYNKFNIIVVENQYAFALTSIWKNIFGSRLYKYIRILININKYYKLPLFIMDTMPTTR